MSNEQDLSQGFPEYHRPPRDIVPKAPVPADAPPIPAGPATYTEHEIDEEGVTTTHGHAWIAPAITRESLAQRRKDDEQ